jgi:hypothetical protein
MVLAAILASIDFFAIKATWQAMSRPEAGIGNGRNGRSYYTSQYLDGRIESVVRDYRTGVEIRTITRPATLKGRIKVWWPVFSSLALTWLAIWFARTVMGRRLLRSLRPPRMSTRGWMIAVAILGIEGGLIVTTLRDSGIRPERADWVPILLYLAIVHGVAFLPVFVVLFHRALAAKPR